MTVYAVSEGSEGEEEQVYSGYCYTTRQVAEDHARRVWLGQVREFGPARDTIPAWLAELDPVK